MNEFVASGVEGPEGGGRPTDWIELYNPGDEPVDLTGFRLTTSADGAGGFVFPDTAIATGAYLLLLATGENVNEADKEFQGDFRIASDGRSVYLFDAQTSLVDSSPSLSLPIGYSAGRFPNGSGDWAYLAESSPAAPNAGPGYSGWADRPGVSRQDGYYPDGLTLTLTAAPGDEVRYTTDGSIPTRDSQQYVEPITLTETTVLRARSFRAGSLPSPIVTRSYLTDPPATLPTVSLVVEPEYFFGRRGIYKRPKTGDEVPASFTYFEAGQPAFSLDLGVKIHAPDNRKQKSLRLYARSGYGSPEIDYPIFTDTEISRFRRLILRNAANDGTENKRIHLKDGYAHRLFRQLDPEYAVAAYQPVRVLLNGDYFGLYNLRERQDEHYLEAHFGYAPEAVDFLEYDEAERNNKKTISGDWENWEALKAYVLEHDLSGDEQYTTVADWIDVNNFIDYQLFEIFIGNQDWLSNNIKFYRPRGANGKWRWVLWDTDYALGTQADRPVGQPGFNFLNMALSWGGWGNQDWTWLLRKLMENDSFRERFTLRYFDLLNSLFLPDYLISELAEVREVIEPELVPQLERWGGSDTAAYEAHYRFTQSFLLARPDSARGNLIGQFNLGKPYTVTVDVDRPERGVVLVNSLTVDDQLPGWQERPYPWYGQYPPDYDVTLQATARPGYRFSHWTGDTASAERILRVRPDRDLQYEAVFLPSQDDRRKLVVLNEVMAGNEATWPDEEGRYSDWLEVYNPTGDWIDLAGLSFSDDPDEPGKSIIPDGHPEETTVGPNAYLILYADSEPDRGARHLDFKISKDGEHLGIYLTEDNDEWETVDQTTTPALGDDESIGRLPNGTGPWEILGVPSPGSSNERLTATAPIAFGDGGLALYPNPARGYVTLDLPTTAPKVVDLRLYGALGTLYREWLSVQPGRHRLNLDNLKGGVYFLEATSRESGRRTTRRLQVH